MLYYVIMFVSLVVGKTGNVMFIIYRVIIIIINPYRPRGPVPL
jgi:hypothetical protein